MTCDAKIRPMYPVSDVELTCELTHTGRTQEHKATLRDYAWPGSETVLSWMEDDRRTFRGTWAQCPVLAGCILPAGHPRGCAL